MERTGSFGGGALLQQTELSLTSTQWHGLTSDCVGFFTDWANLTTDEEFANSCNELGKKIGILLGEDFQLGFGFRKRLRIKTSTALSESTTTAAHVFTAGSPQGETCATTS